MGLWTILKIWRWHRKALPHINFQSQKSHLKSEIDEFILAREKYRRHPMSNNLYAMEEELADVVISAVNFLRYEEGRDFIEPKRVKNLKRKWDNNGHHISNK